MVPGDSVLKPESVGPGAVGSLASYVLLPSSGLTRQEGHLLLSRPRVGLTWFWGVDQRVARERRLQVPGHRGPRPSLHSDSHCAEEGSVSE